MLSNIRSKEEKLCEKISNPNQILGKGWSFTILKDSNEFLRNVYKKLKTFQNIFWRLFMYNYNDCDSACTQRNKIPNSNNIELTEIMLGLKMEYRNWIDGYHLLELKVIMNYTVRNLKTNRCRHMQLQFFPITTSC